MQVKPSTYSPLEEKLNIYSHLAGIILGLVALIFLLFKATDTLSFIVYISYGACIIALFTASTLYHSEKDAIRRARLKVFDHCAIYFMIAGSYIPFLTLGIGTSWAWWLLAGVWLLAISGSILKLFYAGRFQILSTISYVLLGWIVVVAIKPLIAALSTPALTWLALGGAFYTLGAVLYQIKRIPFNHAIFHAFVLLGAYAHFHAIYWHI
ncbi:hemolysin III family protein [Carboxylicivirga mesophila]|uniref:Hemolysin III family protein n=1 Tax=Carboxylicivirga mesophila TaxID=1166478 RepID=A0ABS5KBY6_9BACT|nr:hemolysin III family protein [Carboxylicivirga mesophila]MBS2212464.1 hemolysin III family protein [Carboxylicivirga mesophila]